MVDNSLEQHLPELEEFRREDQNDSQQFVDKFHDMVHLYGALMDGERSVKQRACRVLQEDPETYGFSSFFNRDGQMRLALEALHDKEILPRCEKQGDNVVTKQVAALQGRAHGQPQGSVRAPSV